ncbi:MAG: histidine kinase dimerization/phospho-acceptor domain-containing protein, partial [Agathobacter sp.]|nr:histidine kinase dimerization/phospho-acceptor domain-containing protein [Agathobacter sp.]
MKREINSRLVIIAVLAIILSTIGVTTIYYKQFQAQVQKDLKIDSMIIQTMGIENLVNDDKDVDNVLAGSSEVRITWIAKDGTVLYDNDADESKMENHKNRPEIQNAFKTGVGESVRKSDTMNMKAFNYAVLLEDGTVLRVSTLARSIFSVFIMSSPIVSLIVLFIVVVCVILSHFLTKQLLRPIDKMAENLGNTTYDCEYPELIPFTNRIREQHSDILAAAKSRQDFTANVSHELKTPLTAISGYAELISLNVDMQKMHADNTDIQATGRMLGDENVKSFADKIRKNADRLVSLINDIIRLSELDATDGHDDFSQVDLYEVAQERIEILRVTADKADVKIELHGEKTMVLSNRSMLIELIDNLCQNAIRYNVPCGRVEVEIGKKGNKALLTVTDTGIGIPPEEQS